MDSLTTQQAKLNCLTLGEETSSMFYKQLRVMKGKNSILYFFDQNGVKVEARDDLHEMIVDFYKELLATTDHFPEDFCFPEG